VVGKVVLLINSVEYFSEHYLVSGWSLSSLSPELAFFLGYSLVATFPCHVYWIIVLTKQLSAILAPLQFLKFLAAGCTFRQHFNPRN
jgi:hypothetical protein